MKDYMALYEACKADLDRIGIAYGNVRRVYVNTRLRRTYGTCCEVSRGVFEIAVMARLLEDTVSDAAVKDTLMHELLHTAAPGDHHGRLWRTLADTVNRKLGYSVKRQTAFEEKGLCPPPARKAHYFVTCTLCGQEYGRTRVSKLIRYPHRYRCGKCGGRLVRTAKEEGS